MNKNLKKLPLILIIVLSPLFLSACDDEGLAILEGGIEAWATKNEIYVDGNLKPAGVVKKIIQGKIDEMTHADTSVQFDALEVIRDIEKADYLASGAMETLNVTEINQAINIRPSDWRLREQAGAIYLADNDYEHSIKSFEESDSLLEISLSHGGECLPQRRSQLETRLTNIWEAVKIYESQPGRSQGSATSLREEYDNVRDELFTINTYSESSFCE